MSKITTVYPSVISKIAEIFPTKTRFFDVYSPEQNRQQLTSNGFGVRIDSATPEIKEFCQRAIDRTFTVILTKELIRQEFDTTQVDITSIALLEDVNTLQEEFYRAYEIGQEVSIDQIQLGDCSGIEKLDGDKFSFLKIEISFIITITETVI